ncbi:MAG: FAD-dependent oxidoreductase [Alphaproteobacteria bacterium]|jgi:glycine/D-amino acid oxidase-like deaminating enzyme|nr:FAD-dependent oxidoreductase [Alphaproteobacteria bacterium]
MADIIIIGGSIMGSSIAYHLAMTGRGGDICVIEPDPSYEWAAAPRSSGGVRLMHGLPENIEMSRYGREVYKDFAALMDVDGQPGSFEFLEHGYLYLVAGGPEIAAAEENWRIQTGLGVPNDFLDRDQVAARFLSMNVADIDAAIHAPQDGFIDPNAAVLGFRRKAISLGVTYIQDKVVDIEVAGGLARAVVLGSGARVAGDVIVNVAGAWGPEVCAMVGMRVPVEPLSRNTFYFEIRGQVETMPLTKDPSGVAFRQEGAGFTAGQTDINVPFGFDWDVHHDKFEEVFWPALAHRVPAFEALQVKRGWSGHYAYNRMDGNTIIGKWIGGLDNFYIATGFTGAGLQKGPAIGRAITELLLHGGYQTIDLSRMSYQRVIDDEPLLETGFSA